MSELTEWYVVTDKDGYVLSVNASRSRAEDSKWELENEAGYGRDTLRIEVVSDPNLRRTPR